MPLIARAGSSRPTIWSRPRARALRGGLLFLLALALSACGQPRGVVFEPLESPIRWPPPGEPARIQYVGSIERDTDLKPGKSFGASLEEMLFGKDDEQTMLTPYGVCTDDRGRMFVSDSNAQLIHVFDLEARTYERWQPEPDGTGLAQPIGLAIDHLGRLLVADPVVGAIFIFSADGDAIGTIGEDLLDRPCGIAVDRQRRRLFVADPGAHQVVVIDLDGGPVRQIGRRGIELGEFNFPTAVAVDSTGRLYVSDSLNFRVQVFDTEFTAIRQVGEKGDLPGYFSHPKGIAIDGEDHLYVIDSHFESVQIFDASGALLMTFGEEGHGPGQFWLPTGIHIDAMNRIWVADSYNRRVQVFDYLSEVEQ